MRDRPLILATMTAALSGFVVGIGAYILLEFAFLWGGGPMMHDTRPQISDALIGLCAAALSGMFVGAIAVLAMAWLGS